MRDEWLAEQDRKRRLLASGYTAVLYLALFLIVWGTGLLRPRELAELPGAVMISLDSSEGAPGARPLGHETAPERPAEMAVEPAAPPPPKPATAPASPASPPPPAKNIPLPTEETQTAPPPAPRPFAGTAPSVTSTPAPTSRSFGTAPVAPAAPADASAPGLPGGSGSVTFRGSEKGNSLDTSFGASAGTVGRSLYVPIYSYMPLPAAIPSAVYDAIPGDKNGYFSAESRKKTFRQYYQLDGGLWKLKTQVSLDRRQALWFMLEDAGFDLAEADYKASVPKGSVVIEFVVGPASATSKPSLVDLAIVSSSGSAAIDEAVLYGFRQAAFFNKNAFAVSGKFIYRFGK